MFLITFVLGDNKAFSENSANQVVINGVVYDSEGGLALVTSVEAFSADNQDLNVTLDRGGKDAPQGYYSATVDNPNGAPIFLKFRGRSVKPRKDRSGDLHIAMISYLSGVPRAETHDTIDLVLFVKEGPFKYEAVINQLLTYERAFYLERANGASIRDLQKEYADLIKAIPVGDKKYGAFQRNTIREKRQQLLRLFEVSSTNSCD